MFKYKIRNMEPFKDGTIAELEGRFIKAGEVLIVDEVTFHRMEQSGATLEVLETLVKNPLKVSDVVIDENSAHDMVHGIHPEDTPVLKEVGESQKLEIKRKPGRPKKAAK